MENLVGTEFNMELNMDAMQGLVQRLTDLYTNPIEATVRELVANAFDTTRKLPKKDRKAIRVSAPTELSPAFIVQDYGEGMTRETVETVYAQYGASTKKDDDTQIGAFGLGAKAPLSYASKFVVRTVKDGEVTEVFMTTGEEGNFCEIIQSKEISEPNGTTVTIPVEPSDFDKFAKAISTYKKFMSEDEIIVYNAGESRDSYTEHNLGDFRFWSHDNYNSRASTSEKVFNLIDNLGKISTHKNSYGIAYGIVVSGWVYSIGPSYSVPKFLFEVAPKDLKFTSSRDDVLLDESGYQKIEELIYKATTTILLELNDTIDSMTSHEKLKFIKIGLAFSNEELLKNESFLKYKLPNGFTVSDFLERKEYLKTALSYQISSGVTSNVSTVNNHSIKSSEFKSFVKNELSKKNNVMDSYLSYLSESDKYIVVERSFSYSLDETVWVISFNKEEEIVSTTDKIKNYIKDNKINGKNVVVFVKKENLDKFKEFNEVAVATEHKADFKYIDVNEVLSYERVVKEEYKGTLVDLTGEEEVFNRTYVNSKVSIDTPKEENAVLLAQDRFHVELALEYLMKHDPKIKYVYLIKSHSIKKGQVKNFIKSAKYFLTIRKYELNFMSDLAKDEITPLIKEIGYGVLDGGIKAEISNIAVKYFFSQLIKDVELYKETRHDSYYIKLRNIDKLNEIELLGNPKDQKERQILFLRENVALLNLIENGLNGKINEQFLAEFSKIK